MPNTFAYIALLIWPIISILLYKRLPIINATFWTIVGGYLLLPVKTAMDFPLIPPLDKELIPAIAAFIGCKYIKRVNISFMPKGGIERGLILIMILSPFFTVINNQEIINFRPALSFHDAIANVLNAYIKILPFIIGIQIIKTHEDLVLLLKLLVKAGLLYSILILFEIKMSPQLHTWIYGFFPHSFLQAFRSGGFRAVVFLGHGLLVAMFLAVILGASLVLLKEKIKSLNLSPLFVVLYLIVILVISKSYGALILGMILILSIGFLPVFTLTKVTRALVFIVLLYPMLSVFNLFPHELLVQLANDINAERGGSLGFRFSHENLLLEHAQRKLFFGWGGWGRNRLPGLITDGYWIIVYGTTGLIGFISFFGLLAWSVLKAIKASSILTVKQEQHVMASFALIVTIMLIDQIPNASMAGWMMFLSGSLLGRVKHIEKVHSQIIKNKLVNNIYE